MDFRCRKNKDNVCRRLFQCFEQRVECRIREHVHFVDNVHAIMPTKWREFNILANFPHVIHAGVRRAVDFDDIDRMALRDFQTVGAQVTRRISGALFAVECFGQNAGDRRLADPAAAGEEKSVGDTIVGNRIHQCLDHMRLA